MRPLIGLLLDNGLTYPWFNKIVKSIYVDVAENEFGLQDKKVTDSRVSLITGLYRQEVKRLRMEVDEEYTLSGEAHLSARMIAIWCSDNRFMDEENNPIPLARTPKIAKSRGSQSFDELVEQVTTNIRSRSVLDEWLRVGVVSINQEDEVVLEPSAFFPSKTVEERLYYLGRNVSQHLSAGRANISSAEPPFVERSVFYDELTDESIEELAAFSEKKAMEALTAVNRKARELQIRDRDKSNNHGVMSFGTYYFSDLEEDNKKIGGTDSSSRSHEN